MRDASELGFGQTAGSSIFPAQDADFYKISIDSPGILQAQLSNVPAEMKAGIDFYSKNCNRMTRMDAEKPGDDVLQKEAMEGRLNCRNIFSLKVRHAITWLRVRCM